MNSYQISVALDGKFYFRTEWRNDQSPDAALGQALTLKRAMASVHPTGAVSVTLLTRSGGVKSTVV
jgi:hypothetical protein